MKLGLVISNGRLLYGHRHGWGQCLPRWMKHLVVHMWNNIACSFKGHDCVLFHLYKAGYISLDEVVCSHCCIPISSCQKWHIKALEKLKEVKHD